MSSSEKWRQVLRFKTTSRFESEYQRVQKRGKDLGKLHDVMERLINEESLAPKFRDHALKGEYKDRRECHIEPLYTKWTRRIRILSLKGLVAIQTYLNDVREAYIFSHYGIGRIPVHLVRSSSKK